MLILPVRSAGELVTLADSADPGRPAVALAHPRVAPRPGGAPGLRLLRWVLPPDASSGAAPPPRSRLDLDVTLSPTVADLAAAGLSESGVKPMPWLDARLQLLGPQLEPLESEVAVAPGAGAPVGAVSMELTPQAGALLASLLTQEAGSPLQLIWSGHVRVQLPPVEVVASASVEEVRRRIDRTRGATRTVVTRSIVDANAHVEIKGASDPELEEALREWALDQLTERLAAGEDLSVRAAASDVVRWPLRLAATLDPLAPGEDRHRLVETHVLEADELGAVPPVEVRVLGDFSGPLERVDVRLEPLEAGGGSPVDLAVTDQETRRASIGSPGFRWRRRVKHLSRPAGEWSSWRTVERSSALLIPVPTSGDLRVEATAAGLDLERRWSSVRVHARHEGPPASSKVLELDAARRSAVWEEPLRGPRGRLSASVVFLSSQGRSVEQELGEVEGDQIVLRDPYDSSRRRLALVPAGSGWSDIATAMVDLRYRDGEEAYEETIPLEGPGDFAEWEAPARPDGPRAVEWRCHASFQDGRYERSDWAAVEGPVLAVPLESPRRREVQVLPVFLEPDWEATVQIRSGDVTLREVFAGKTPRSVTLPPGSFRWSVEWRLPDGSRRELPEQQSDEDVLVLPRAPR